MAFFFSPPRRNISLSIMSVTARGKRIINQKILVSEECQIRSFFGKFIIVCTTVFKETEKKRLVQSFICISK